MAALDTLEKLGILADAAKYDASCASSGTGKRNSKSGGIGSTAGIRPWVESAFGVRTCD